jgi:hypothetical protein
MPVGWIGFSTATPPELQELRHDPPAMREYVQGVIERAGAEFIDLFFEVSAERAYALVRELDDYISAKAVMRILGADEYTKLLDANQAAESLGREQDFRPPSE